MRTLIALALAASLALAACGGDDDNTSTKTTTAASPVTGGVRPGTAAAQPTAGQLSDGNAPGIPPLTGEIKNEGSLRYIDEAVGSGDQPKAGQCVQVHYTGWLTSGQKFDSSRDRNQPFSFPLGQGRVIRGWDIGLASMRIGGKRRLIIPADLGYGARGQGPIPANSTLIFDVELLSVRDAGGTPC